MAKNKCKKWYKSKTVWAGIATIATGMGMYVSGEQSLQDLMIAIIGAVFTVLRCVTKDQVSM